MMGWQGLSAGKCPVCKEIMTQSSKGDLCHSCGLGIHDDPVNSGFPKSYLHKKHNF